ncbi:PLP-dependent aminotransferase family protein [Egibacter rhizosphaerae]|uniref:aminotransferase-like domain-containing protein n=1 Tax=Egibacter rhizosphaerae TaxID=1670831 RepID=UPI0013F14481|nr:PLP-dependent aminotransferase family protein [Egibacter rhizosphaerae]
MSEIRLDSYEAHFAARTRGMAASEIRALFAVANRPEVVSLAGGMPFLSALDLDAVGDLARQVIAEEGSVALQYGGGQGHAPLREQLAHVMDHEGVPAHADELVVTTGGQQALDLTAKLLCNPGDVVLAEGPSYVGALSAFSAYEAEVMHVPMDGDGIAPDVLAERLGRIRASGRRPKFLYTVPNHQNPAGVSLSEGRRQQLAEIAAREDLLIVEDNPYGLLDFKGEMRTALRSLVPERTIYIGTLSKIFSPGIRVGWIAAPGPLREKFVLLKEAADLCQSNLTQLLANRWLSTQDWQGLIEAFRDGHRERSDAMLSELTAEMPEGSTWNIPAGGFFVWLSLPPGMDARELLPKALNARVAYVPGAAFFADGSGGEHMRLSYCYPTPDRIREGVRRLGSVVRTEAELRDAMYGEHH